MIKIFLLIILIYILNHCSLDKKSGIWENKKEPKINKKLSDIQFDKDLTYEEFKENVVQYGKLSKFPKLKN